MSRTLVFFLGLAIGAFAVAATFVLLGMAPRMRLSLDSPAPPPGLPWSDSRTSAGTPPAGAARPALSQGGALRTTNAAAAPAVSTPVPVATAPVVSVQSASPIAVPTSATNSSATPAEPVPVVAPYVAIAAAAAPALLIPVAGVRATALLDSFAQARGARRHEAIDIMAARGTSVLAAADGRLVKLFNSKLGGLTIYQFDPSQTYVYYYAHLDGYAPGLVEGSELKRGDVIGRVGSTGNASVDGPHLHFAVLVLGPEHHWWQGVAIDPYPLLTGGAAGSSR